MEILLLLISFGLGGLVTTVLVFTIQSNQQFSAANDKDKNSFFRRIQSNARRFR